MLCFTAALVPFHSWVFKRVVCTFVCANTAAAFGHWLVGMASTSAVCWDGIWELQCKSQSSSVSVVAQLAFVQRERCTIWMVRKGSACNRTCHCIRSDTINNLAGGRTKEKANSCWTIGKESTESINHSGSHWNSWVLDGIWSADLLWKT